MCIHMLVTLACGKCKWSVKFHFPHWFGVWKVMDFNIVWNKRIYLVLHYFSCFYNKVKFCSVPFTYSSLTSPFIGFTRPCRQGLTGPLLVGWGWLGVTYTIILFFTTKDTEGLPEQVTSLASGPPPRQHGHIGQSTTITHTFIQHWDEGWGWRWTWEMNRGEDY